jgi:hypothetical protein
MFKKFLARLFTRKTLPPVDPQPSPAPPVDLSALTGKDFEFLITPGDLAIPAADVDNLLTPDSFGWTKLMKGNWPYYQVDDDEFTYSWEPPGIQMTFSSGISYPKAKAIVDEVVRKLSAYTGQSVEWVVLSGDVPIRFDDTRPFPIATFQVRAAFELTGRYFFLLGEILSGRIQKGMTVDLRPIGIDKRLILEAIEFALRREEDKTWEEVGLGISGLTAAEKEHLKTGSPFSRPIRLIRGTYLFTVEATFVITDRGVVLYPGFENNSATLGSPIRLIRPDQSIIETQIRGVSFSENHDILIGEKIKKEDVPIGTEVWLQESN